VSRRQLLHRLGAVAAVGLPLVAACSAPAAAPTAPTTAPAKPTAPPAAPTTAPTAPPTAPAAQPTAAATTAPAAAATTAPAAAAQTSTRPKMIIGIVQEPTALDPTADATASIAGTLLDNLYQVLVRLDASGKVTPSLARSWDVSPDGAVITFKLATGVKWHDGSPFTAQDVKFSYERAASAETKPPNPHRDYWAPMTKVEALDDATIKVTLSSYSDNWLFHMAAGSACIVSSKSADNNKTNPIGTGPFKFSAWNRGASLTLTRNEDYWGTKAPLKDVEFRIFSDADALNNAIKAGDIDVIGQVQGPEQIKQFEQDQNFTVIKGAGAGKVMVAMNETSGPLADKRVRQALYAAIDRKAWIDGVAAGYAVPIGSHATPNDGEPYYADMTSVNTYDVAKAKRLLGEAGVSNLSLRLAQISAFPYAVRGTDILLSQLQAIGVTLDVQPMEFPRWLQEVFLNKQDYDLTIINHVEERDIGNYGNPKYYWHYDNPELAGWLKEADAQPDAAKRKELYTRIQQQLADDAANLWLYAPNQLAVLKANVKNYQVPGISPSIFVGDAYFS
jgi:peptide/nickel transport system substrate-binding protein